MPRPLRLALAALALAGFVLALAVHAAAVCGVDASDHVPGVWWLHVGIFVVFFPYVFAMRKAVGQAGDWRQAQKALVPAPLRQLGSALLTYAVLNFMWTMLTLSHGSPAVVDGQYVLQNHGHVVGEITQAQYAAGKAAQMRLFSGHWMAFYFLPFAFFGFAKRPADDRLA